MKMCHGMCGERMKSKGILSCVLTQEKNNELRKKLFESLNAFWCHVRVKRVQAGAFEYDKKDESFFVLHFDFAMAFLQNTGMK